MNKQSLTSVLLYLSIVVVLCMSTGCRVQQARNIKFPSYDIVFQANSGEDYKLGFMNADGTNVTLFSTKKTRITQPIWSLDKQTIYFRIIVREHPGIENQDRSGYLGILQNGGAPDAVCEGVVSPTNVVLPTGNSRIVLLEEGNKLGFVDIEQCEWKEFIKNEEGFCSYSLSTDETVLLYSEVHDQRCSITTWNTKTKQTVSIGEGKSAAFSPDSTKVSFIRPEGIFVMDRNGENVKELVHFSSILKEYHNYYDIPTMPVWSPDGEWLIYHKCLPADGLCETTDEFSIFKVHVSDGYEVKLYDGGLNPYWR